LKEQLVRPTPIVSGIRSLSSDDIKLVSADVVTGPYDSIVVLEASDLDQLARFVTDKIHAIDGVLRVSSGASRLFFSAFAMATSSHCDFRPISI